MLKQEIKSDPETEVDPETRQKEEVFFEKKKIYVKSKEEVYHTDEKCEYLAFSNFETKKPCGLCLEATEDVLNSRIGSKTLGFVSGETQYHDDECLLWVQKKTKS